MLPVNILLIFFMPFHHYWILLLSEVIFSITFGLIVSFILYTSEFLSKYFNYFNQSDSKKLKFWEYVSYYFQVLFIVLPLVLLVLFGLLTNEVNEF